MMNTMTHRGYTASMIFDPEDKIIVGRVLDVDDIITFHGESVAEFESTFHTVVDDYITACESLSAAAEKPASGKLMLRVAPDIHAAAVKAAARSGISLNKWAEQALSQASRKTSLVRRSGTESNLSFQRTLDPPARSLSQAAVRVKRR